MRNSLLIVATAALFAVVNAENALGQRHEIPALKSCIREFYDPEMYDYLTYKNNCSQALSMVFVAKDGLGTGGSMDLRAGGKDSVGRSADGRAPKIGDFELYVCVLGYVPIDDSGKLVSKPRSNFKCQPKSQ